MTVARGSELIRRRPAELVGAADKAMGIGASGSAVVSSDGAGRFSAVVCGEFPRDAAVGMS